MRLPAWFGCAIAALGGCVVTVWGAAAPASGPAPATMPSATTAPTTAPVDDSPTLMRGQLEFDVPKGWRFITRSENGLGILYHSADDMGSFTMTVTVQPQAIGQSSRLKQAGQKLGEKVIEGLVRATTNLKAQVIMAPRIEPDDRLYVRVHHQYKLEGASSDQVIAYQPVGRDLVMLAVTSLSESAAASKAIHEQAISALLSVRPGRGKPEAKAAGKMPDVMDKVIAPTSRSASPASAPAEGKGGGISVAYPKAGVRLIGPSGWRQESSDNTTGVIASYRNSEDPSDLIIVSVRPLPEEAKANAAARQKIIDEMVKMESTQLKLEGAKGSPPETIKDSHFLRKVRTAYHVKEDRFLVESRQVVVGSILVSVTSLSGQDRSQEVGAAADKVALGARAMAGR